MLSLTLTPKLMLYMMDAWDRGMLPGEPATFERVEEIAEEIYNSGPHADIPHRKHRFDKEENYIQEYCLGLAAMFEDNSWIEAGIRPWTPLDERIRLEAA